jgi:hypothetical protein
MSKRDFSETKNPTSPNIRFIDSGSETEHLSDIDGHEKTEINENADLSKAIKFERIGCRNTADKSESQARFLRTQEWLKEQEEQNPKFTAEETNQGIVGAIHDVIHSPKKLITVIAAAALGALGKYCLSSKENEEFENLLPSAIITAATAVCLMEIAKKRQVGSRE